MSPSNYPKLGNFPTSSNTVSTYCMERLRVGEILCCVRAWQLANWQNVSGVNKGKLGNVSDSDVQIFMKPKNMLKS